MGVNAGATFKMANDLRIKGDDHLYSVAITGSGETTPRDTLSTSGINGRLNLPLQSTIGIGLGKPDKWYFGLEYEMQDAISTTSLLTNNSGAYRYDSSNRFSAGGYFLPKASSISSYWDRVTYRAGIRAEKTGLLVDGTGSNTNFTSINDFGISFGLGLPLKALSNLNLGFEFGKRGT